MENAVKTQEAARVLNMPYVTLRNWITKGVTRPIRGGTGPGSGHVFTKDMLRRDAVKLAARDAGAPMDMLHVIDALLLERYSRMAPWPEELVICIVPCKDGSVEVAAVHRDVSLEEFRACNEHCWLLLDAPGIERAVFARLDALQAGAETAPARRENSATVARKSRQGA